MRIALRSRDSFMEGRIGNRHFTDAAIDPQVETEEAQSTAIKALKRQAFDSVATDEIPREGKT